MSRTKKRTFLQHRLPPVESVLRAVLARQDAVIPVTPEEVAAYDARHADDPPPAAHPARPPSPRFSWEHKAAPPGADNLVVFPTPAVPGRLAFAAREGGAVSPETRARLAGLVEEMKRDR